MADLGRCDIALAGAYLSGRFNRNDAMEFPASRVCGRHSSYGRPCPRDQQCDDTDDWRRALWPSWPATDSPRFCFAASSEIVKPNSLNKAWCTCIPMSKAGYSSTPSHHPNRRRLLLLVNVRINIHRQPDITMPRQGLGRLGRHIRPAEVRDEGVPHGVEVGVEALGVLVAEEV